MRVVVNNIAASSGGALTILNSFYQFILEHDDKTIEWIFLLSDSYLEETENIKVIIKKEIKKSWISRLKFDLFTGKRCINELKPDLIISLQNTIVFGLQIPQILYVHQALPFQKSKNFSFLKKKERTFAIYQYLIGALILKSIDKSSFTIVQTQWMKDIILEKTGRASNDIIIIPPDFKTEKYYKDIKNIDCIENNFFYPAADLIYKNHGCLYDACKILSKRGIKEFSVILTLNSNAKHENIEYVGQLSHKEVLNKYNETTLVFPSYIETVGLPLLEAKNMGTLILVADCEYSREVLGNYENAYFFNHFDSNDLANLMEKVIERKIVKKSIPNIVNVRRNGWEKIMELIPLDTK